MEAVVQQEHVAALMEFKVYTQWGRGCHVIQHDHNYTKLTHSHNNDTAIRRNLGLSILVKDTSTQLGKLGIEQATLDDLLNPQWFYYFVLL